MCVTAAITLGFLGREEHSTAIFDRVATLADVSNDGSANVRVYIADQGIKTILQYPLGFGFGSGGNAIKARTGEQDSVGDNGYLEILTTLGIPGAFLYAAGLLLIIRLAFRESALFTWNEPTTHLGFGMLIAMGPALVIGNCLSTAHASYVWIILSRHLSAMRSVAVARRPKKLSALEIRPIVMPRQGPQEI